MTDATDIPVYKVGMVIMRGLDKGDPEILIVRTKPKKEGEIPPLVLPRGSRAYRSQDAQGNCQWLDARDDETARAHASTMEPLVRTLIREAHEEAGLQPYWLKQQDVYELGERPFVSRGGATKRIHWFAIMPDQQAIQSMEEHQPEDATEVRWARLSEIELLVRVGEFSAGYIPIIQEAVKASYYEKEPLDLRVLGNERASSRQRSFPR